MKWKRNKVLTFIAPISPPNAAILAASSALPPLGSRWLNVPSGCRDGDGILLYKVLVIYILNRSATMYGSLDAKTFHMMYKNLI